MAILPYKLFAKRKFKQSHFQIILVTDLKVRALDRKQFSSLKKLTSTNRISYSSKKSFGNILIKTIQVRDGKKHNTK